jgi:hypothetical protein
MKHLNFNFFDLTKKGLYKQNIFFTIANTHATLSCHLKPNKSQPYSKKLYNASTSKVMKANNKQEDADL